MLNSIKNTHINNLQKDNKKNQNPISKMHNNNMMKIRVNEENHTYLKEYEAKNLVCNLDDQNLQKMN